MNIKLPQLLALAAGGILLYSAIRDVSPADVIKAVLTGQDMPKGQGSGTVRVPVVGHPGATLGSDGRYLPQTDNNTPQPQGDGTHGTASESYTVPYPSAPTPTVSV